MDSLPLHYSHVMILLIPPKTEKNTTFCLLNFLFQTHLTVRFTFFNFWMEPCQLFPAFMLH